MCGRAACLLVDGKLVAAGEHSRGRPKSQSPQIYFKDYFSAEGQAYYWYGVVTVHRHTVAPDPGSAPFGYLDRGEAT